MSDEWTAEDSGDLLHKSVMTCTHSLADLADSTFFGTFLISYQTRIYLNLTQSQLEAHFTHGEISQAIALLKLKKPQAKMGTILIFV